MQLRASLEERAGQDGARVQQVLAVVDHEQEAFAGKEVRERDERPVGRAVLGTERDEDGLRDEQRVVDRGQRREPDAIGKAARHLGGSADRQPRLAHPATARQRQQARGRQQPLDFMQLVAPPDEAGRLDRQFRSPSLRGGGLHRQTTLHPG